MYCAKKQTLPGVTKDAELERRWNCRARLVWAGSGLGLRGRLCAAPEQVAPLHSTLR